jgi:hypothetical protein
MDARESREQLWDRLSNESGRAYEAFKVYMFMSPAERSVVGAWREWTGNPEAARPSPFFKEWAREYAWPERARAHDHHLEVIRESGMEEAVKEEAKKQAKQVEHLHWRYQELMTLGYERAVEYLESAEFVKHMRPADVVALIKLHFEGVQKLGQPQDAAQESGVDLSEDELREVDLILDEIESENAHEEGAPEPEAGENDGFEEGPTEQT